jgi:hypothetical protein
MKLVTLTEKQHEQLLNLFRHRMEEVGRNWPAGDADEQAIIDALEAATEVPDDVGRGAR